jgi:Zn-dependent protease
VRRPLTLTEDDEVTRIASIFRTPVVARGWGWIPLAQLVGWWISYRHLSREFPLESRSSRIRYAGLQAGVMLGSEWGHNLAHAAAASATGYPMDAIRIQFGMPMLVYFDVNDPAVRPGTHIIRAIAGPIFNACLLPFFLWWRSKASQGTLEHELAQAGARTNAFLCTGSLSPVPDLDGGPILKWSLIARGCEIRQADAIVRKVNGPAAFGLGLISAILFRTGRKVLGFLAAALAISSLIYALGWIRSQD